MADQSASSETESLDSFEASPESLDALRTTVRDWVEKARNAVLSHMREDNGSFWRDSGRATEMTTTQQKPRKISTSTTARCYMALVYADRSLGVDRVPKINWKSCFSDFCGKEPLGVRIEKLVEENENNGIVREVQELEKTIPKDEKNSEFNNFDIVHLADVLFVENYLESFTSEGNPDANSANPNDLLSDNTSGALSELLSESLNTLIDQAPKLGDSNPGQLPLPQTSKAPGHFFVTLHALRALEILGAINNTENDEKALPNESDNKIVKLAKSAEQFCIQQCFYAQRSALHKQDTFSLAFAGVVYCMYSEQIDKDLLLAIVETIASAQRENGIWPANHPIQQEGKGPWYISSHDIALCLTWLYFQPRILDSGRRVLLAMMEKYFRNWVVPTHRRIQKPFVEAEHDDGLEESEKVSKPTKAEKRKDNGAKKGEKGISEKLPYEGWFDDHSVSDEEPVGWANAIVCHFLSNYHAVLDDHINRRVIESLGLEAPSKRYLIDDTAHDKNKHWPGEKRKRAAAGVLVWQQAVWPDLPPLAWRSKPKELAREITWKWTDPTPDEKLSNAVAKKILGPIFEDPSGRPAGDRCAGILPGPPGTRKTSFVRSISEILEWPLVPVPASVIFDRSFDYMETRATEVFQQLNYLTRCVIFFDEFEEFFRDRKDSNDSTVHDRTIAAFTTSAMLPRLQDLHEQGQCLIFMATNHLDNLDDAIIRPGRFDFSEEIGHPTRDRIESYLAKPSEPLLKHLHINNTEEVKRAKIGKQADGDKLKELSKIVIDKLKKLYWWHLHEVPFSHVEDALATAEKKWNSEPNSQDKDAIAKAAQDSLELSRERAKSKTPPSLSRP